MRGVLRVVRQDLLHLLEGLRGLVLVFLLPPLLVGLVGQLSVHTPPFRVLVAGSPGADDRIVYDEFLALLGDVSTVTVDTVSVAAVDPMADLEARGLDLLINVEGSAPGDWVMYTADEGRLRLASLRQLTGGLERGLRSIEAWSEGRDADAAEPIRAEAGRWTDELRALGALPPERFMAYYPRALDRTLELVGNTLVLILCFLPFVLAAPSFIREKDAHTLEVLLAAPGIDARALAAGKCLFVLVVTLAELLLLLVLAESLYGIHVKPGFLDVPFLFLPAILSTALLGLAVSAMAVSQAQVALSLAVYFLAITLLTGFFVPLEEASGLVQALSRLFPITFVMPSFRAWSLGAAPIRGHGAALAGLWIQCVAYGALAAAALRHALRRV